MMTLIVYWNATKFTRYEHIREKDYCIHDGYFHFVLPNRHGMIIPWTTINRIEVVMEDS